MTDRPKLFRYAIDYLSKFSSSKANLERILKGKIRRLKLEKKDKHILYSSINDILTKLENNNFINDSQYSSSKIRNFIFQGKSKMFIKSYLFQKGVDTLIINNSLEECKLENNNWEEEAAKTFVRKKNLSNEKEFREKNLAKMARAGFSYEISKKTLGDI